MLQILPVLEFLQFGRIGSKDDQANCLLWSHAQEEKNRWAKTAYATGEWKNDTSLWWNLKRRKLMCLSKQRRSGSTEKLLLITGVRNAPVISQHKLFRLCINSTASGEPVVNNGEIPVTCMVQIKYGSTSKFLNLFDSLSCPLCLFNGWSGFLELWTLKYYQRASYVLGFRTWKSLYLSTRCWGTSN